jgi:hypothetical protein
VAGRARLGFITLLGLLALTVAWPTGASGAVPKNRPAAPGWVVERLEAESASPGGFLIVNGLGDYRGKLELVRSGPRVAVVNEVGLEDYVRGIREVPTSWAMEALRAQAIAARTYALHVMANPREGEETRLRAHICDTQDCQVYAGLEMERQPDGQRWLAAVESTKGQVLLKKGAPIRAMYSATPPGPPPGPPPPNGAKPRPPIGHGMGMSQPGAQSKASRGMKAGAILASYYKGIRPTRLPPDRLPSTIRVVVDTGRPSVLVSSPAQFVLQEAGGRMLAVAATGNWRITPGPQGKLLVQPPRGQELPPALEALSYESAGAAPFSVGVVRFALSAPALVHMTVQSRPGGPALITAGELLQPGEQVLAVPNLPNPGPAVGSRTGDHLVSVVADAGAGRVSTATLRITGGHASLVKPAATDTAGSAPKATLVTWASLATWLVIALVALGWRRLT